MQEVEGSFMNLLDVIFVIVIVISSIYGLFKGLIKEVISVLAVIIGLILASRLYEKVSPIFGNLGVNEQVSNILSFFVLFIIISFSLPWDTVVGCSQSIPVSRLVQNYSSYSRCYKNRCL